MAWQWRQTRESWEELRLRHRGGGPKEPHIGGPFPTREAAIVDAWEKGGNKHDIEIEPMVTASGEEVNPNA